MRVQQRAVAFQSKNRSLPVLNVGGERARQAIVVSPASPLSVLASATLIAAATAGLGVNPAFAADPPADAAASQHIAPPVLSLNIAAQPIHDALNEFARQSGLQVFFLASKKTEQLISTPIAGTFDPAAALSKLLANTGLSYEYLDTRSIAIVDPMSKATKTNHTAAPLRGKGTGAKADDGSMRLTENNRDPNNSASSSQSGAQQSRNLDRTDISRQTAHRQDKIQEIVVTAQKREERLIDVPISITAISAEEIDRRGLVGAADYLRGIPGVNQVDAGWGGQTIVIRGLETTTQDQGFYSGATVATYFGETPTTNAGGTLAATPDIKLVDVERVEVLRGPQGTAFGNSSLGGAVRTIPVAPKLGTFEGKAAVAYSSTSDLGSGNYQFYAVGNVPLIGDKLAIRAVGYRFSDSGYYQNRAGSDASFQASLVSPVTGAPYFPGGQYALGNFAIDETEAGSIRATGGRIAALFKANDNLRFTVSYLTQKNELDGYALQNAVTGTYDQTILRVAPEHVRRGQGTGLSDNHVDMAGAVMEYDIGWADLVATYSHIDGKTLRVLPFSALNLPWPASLDYSPGLHREDSGEIRIATKFDGAWNFLAGLYAEQYDDSYDIDIRWYGDPATDFFAPGESFLGEYHDRRDLKQTAAFGEVSWQFLPSFTLTGGVRAYKYERSIGVERTGPIYGLPDAIDSFRDHGDASDNNFRGNLSYKPNDSAHLYAGWAQGFRLGKPQSGVPEGACDVNNDGVIDGSNVTIESTRFVDSDSVDSYEVGGKFALLDRRLTIDTAVYRMDWSGLPVNVAAPCVGGGYLANASAARSEGIEVQANLQLNNAWRVDIGGSWIDAKITEDAPIQGFFAGQRLPGAPKTNANLGLQYAFLIAGNSAFVRADSIYVGSFGSNVNDPAHNGDYVKVDATARVMIGNLNVDLFVRNLTDRDEFTYGTNTTGTYGYRMRPRTIGIQVGYSFD